MKRHENSTRLNLDLGPKSYEALMSLQEDTEASSQVETIRLALHTLATLVEEIKRGGKVYVERDEEKIELKFPTVGLSKK